MEFRVEKILGYSEDEWIGQHASIIFTPPEQAQQLCQSEMTMAADVGWSSDIRWHQCKDGSQLFAHGFMNALTAADGTLLGFSKILSDETKNKQLQDSLMESNMALEQFSYVASHDLQEPLRTITAYAELLKRRSMHVLEGDSARFLELIIKGAERMSSLVHDLLMYARDTKDAERAFSYSLDMDLESAITQLQQLIEENNAVVTHDTLPEIAVQEGQMVRLFQNLVGNALKYRKPDVDPKIHVSAERAESGWIITVSDNGIGFDPQFAKQIFAPFKRLHGQDSYPGTGVGLAICQRIVESHGGKIWADSQPGKGAEFHFLLPAGE